MKPAAPIHHPTQLCVLQPSSWKRWRVTTLILASAISFAGCTSLKPVADFGSKASSIMGYPEVAKDYPEILTRSKLAGETGPGVNDEKIAERKRDVQRLQDAQKVLQDYAKALGGLAADDLINYDKQVDDLSQSLVGGKIATSDEAASYASAAKVGLRFITDLYRRAKIKQLITKYNRPVQKAVAQMTVVIDGYLVTLDNEQTMYNQLVCGRLEKSARSTKLDGFEEFIAVACADHNNLLLAKAANAKALALGLATFGRGHQELAENVGKVSFKQLVSTAGMYADQLQAVLKSFKATLSCYDRNHVMSEILEADALVLAKLFKQAATSLGQYQLDHWDGLSADNRGALTEEEYTLLDYSQSLVTYAVGAILDDAQISLDQIKKATQEANNAIETAQDIKKALGIASALVTLGAAIAAGNPSGIASAVGQVMDTVSG